MKTKTAPAFVSTSSAPVVSGFTLGLDLGDRQHHVCVLDVAGQMVREAALPNTRPALAQLLVDYPRATIALEAGTHSPWISRFLTDLGATVLVANPRKLHAISRHERKCDRRNLLGLKPGLRRWISVRKDHCPRTRKKAAGFVSERFVLLKLVVTISLHAVAGKTTVRCTT